MTHEMVAYAGFATKGLEDVAADELRELVPSASVAQDRPKAVRFAVDGAPDRLARLRCFDDVVVEVAASPGSGSLLDDDDVASGIRAAHRLIQEMRPVGDEVSMTVSAVRTDKHVLEELRSTVLEIAQVAIGLRLKPAGRATFDIRLQVDAGRPLIGVRLFDQPLASLRPPRAVHRPGGLRPTIAAAMVRVAASAVTSPATVWDPFCGSGTILLEAAHAGHQVLGSDVSAEAVEVTVQNLTERVGGQSVRVGTADAFEHPLWEHPEPGLCLVSNLPWNKQVPISRRTTFFRSVGRGLASLTSGGGTAVILTTDPGPIVAAARQYGSTTDPVERRLGFGGQTPTLLAFT